MEMDGKTTAFCGSFYLDTHVSPKFWDCLVLVSLQTPSKIFNIGNRSAAQNICSPCNMGQFRLVLLTCWYPFSESSRPPNRILTTKNARVSKVSTNWFQEVNHQTVQTLASLVLDHSALSSSSNRRFEDKNMA